MADIDLWPISTLPVADIVFHVANMVCGRYRCNSILATELQGLTTCVGIAGRHYRLWVWGISSVILQLNSLYIIWPSDFTLPSLVVSWAEQESCRQSKPNKSHHTSQLPTTDLQWCILSKMPCANTSWTGLQVAKSLVTPCADKPRGRSPEISVSKYTLPYHTGKTFYHLALRPRTGCL